MKEEPEFFKIVQNQLVPHTLNYNKIRFKNNDNSTISYIYFDKINEFIIYVNPYSTGVINTDSDYFSFKITDLNEKVTKIQGRINKGETGDIVNIKPPYNISKDFSMNDLLILECPNKDLIEIFDFPTQGEIYLQKESNLKLVISKSGLREMKMLNTIIFKSNVNNPPIMATIDFDINNKKLIVKSTGEFFYAFIHSAFYFALKDSTGNITKIKSAIDGRENANKFARELNNISFEFGDLLALSAAYPKTVIVTNYPNQGDDFYPITLVTHNVTLKITPFGIKPLP